MANKYYPKSQLPIRKTSELLPQIFQTPTNDKFLSGVVDPLVQPGSLEKIVGYIGKRYGKTYRGQDTYLDSDETLRSRYQLETGVVVKNKDKDSIEKFYDYLDVKNQLKFFGNDSERDDLFCTHEHYSWEPPINWDMFINYREYYWQPSGPPSIKVFGQNDEVQATYRVSLGTGPVFIFAPDGFTNNPTITLYRGQTYKFIVNVPNNGFYIRTNYDTGSLLYNPNRTYFKEQLVVFDGKLFKAKTTVFPEDGSTIDENSQDWEFVEQAGQGSALDYVKGITNNGAQSGTVTFTVPFDAPETLFYQSLTEPDRFGRFIISNIESNTSINVNKEIIGMTTYRSANGVEFTNGLKVTFGGKVTPAKYATGNWIIQGVGSSISLVNFDELKVPTITTDSPDVLFDDAGFDSGPFDDASGFPGSKDYVTIDRGSKDFNPWSRYNRWFHRSVLEYAHKINGSDFNSDETLRAKRPIIEFRPNIQLINHGSIFKGAVDFIDNFTADVFSTIEGSRGYIVDGEPLFDGAKLLVTADTDTLANNRIYEVKFITHNGVRQISLKKTENSESNESECVLINLGVNYKNLMFHYENGTWIPSQVKTKVNQPPLFDVFDVNGVSLSNEETYPVTSFVGTELLSYKIGNSVVDRELGFPISYLNINNVGDIQFEFDWEQDRCTYKELQTRNTIEVEIKTGFYKIFSPTLQYQNGWIRTNDQFLQPIIDSTIIQEDTNVIEFFTVDWKQLNQLVEQGKPVLVVFYLNGKKLEVPYTATLSQFTFETKFVKNDTVAIKIFADIDPDQGYYEIPVGLEKNPLNQDLDTFTLGTFIDHVETALEFDDRLIGNVIGPNNLRDLSDYAQHGKRFLKHGGLPVLAVSLLADKQANVIRSIEYAKNSYSLFKSNFLKLSEELFFTQDVVDFVDDILKEMTKTKIDTNSFFDSDMIGTGAFTSIDYEVDDPGIKTFALNEKFDLSSLSRKAVYVYVNDRQLLHKRDYEFNANFGFVLLKVDLQEGDRIQIREYVSTSFCFIPATPTKLGLYKKYIPRKYYDDTYVTPRWIIEGHDGSRIAAFNDFRDELILELEFRIYNNLKQEYNEKIFDNDLVLGGYYGTGFYSKDALDGIVDRYFLNWLADTNIDYTTNQYLDSENSFTYTYSNMTSPDGTKNLPGWWRGVYTWFYDTDRPHTDPWEMLGFSEKPDWWEDEYGPAPYTRNNLILWEDIRDGIIRQGSRAGTYDRYKRPSIMTHIPTDDEGKLLSPLESNLAQNYVLINNRGNFKLGDISPAEHAWRTSSEWPFAVVAALSLLRPFEFIPQSLDRSTITTNIIGQTINKGSNWFFKPGDINIPGIVDVKTSGIISYVVDYLKNRGLPSSIISDLINNIDVGLSSRLSGFVDQENQKYILDSKSPSSNSSAIFIPVENYDIIFNVSAPISSFSYSGVILEKTERGWKLNGYDKLNPVFNYYEAAVNQADVFMTVGGVSEKFVEWAPETFFGNGVIVRYNNDFYRSLKSHTSDTSFNTSLWKKIPKLPLVGGVDAYRRTNFNRTKIKQLPYGLEFTTIQAVVDFLLGYEDYLKSIGLVFDGYDTATQTAKDFGTSCKEFMFWTKHNWAVGSLISLSPIADKIEISNPVGVVDSVVNDFYDYRILRNDGLPLLPNFINVKRDFQKFTIETTNTTFGIYFLKVYYVLKEHVVVFDDRTVFNDVIYDKTTGYRQERIKCRGFRTVDWDGDYTSPGFLFDNVTIDPWQPFTDYKLGDIVTYQSVNYVSQMNQIGVESFDDTKWSKLDSSPTKKLVPNFDYRINQFEDYYNLDSDGVGASQRDLGRHAIGYQKRDYLQNLAEDEVTQFRLYQGFIREKGTSNALIKVFDKTSRTNDDSLVLKEEWAFRVGQLGGTDQVDEIEFEIIKDKFVLNPQPVLITDSQVEFPQDQYYRIDSSKFTLSKPVFSKDINPLLNYEDLNRSAGYVKLDQVEHVVKNRDEILTLDITTFRDNHHVWVTFDKNTWTVLRYNKEPLLIIEEISKNKDVVEIVFNRNHNIAVDEIVGFEDIPNLTGFFKVYQTDFKLIRVKVKAADPDPEFDNSSVVSNPCLFIDARESSYESINPAEVAVLPSGAKIWIDNTSSKWQVIEKSRQYQFKDLLEYGITTPNGTGYKVLYLKTSGDTIASMPQSGYVMIYAETPLGLKVREIISPPESIVNRLGYSFGKSMAVSPDERFLIIGSPNASGVPSSFMGTFDPTKIYLQGEIVYFGGRLWRALDDVIGDGSTINVNSDQWGFADLIEVNTIGRNQGYTNQGLLSVYEYRGTFWELTDLLLSPRPGDGEEFGSNITIGKSGTLYYMAVAAPGALDRKGRVYLYQYDTTGTFGVSGVTIVNPGTGYTDGDTLTVTVGGRSASFVVSTLNGVVRSLTILDPGQFITTTTATQSTSVFPTGGTGCTISLTFSLTRSAGWRHLENQNYSGIYNSDEFYPKGSIVWYDNALYEATADTLGDGSTGIVSSESWKRLDDVATHNSVPGGPAIEDDGSSLDLGLLSEQELAELVKAGDEFGHSMAMNGDGSVLVIGAPNSDGEYHPNFRGIYNSYQEYREGDVVKHRTNYYRLDDPNPSTDSTYTVKDQNPDIGAPWVNVGTVEGIKTGKIYIYKRTPTDRYELIQTITAESLEEFNDIGDEFIKSGDRFGFSLDLDLTGTTLVVSSPDADIDFVNQGVVYVFKTNNLTNIEFRLKQKLQSFEKYSNEQFGYSVCISEGTEKIAVGAKNSLYNQPTFFDLSLDTIYDKGRTTFFDDLGYPGRGYIFERKEQLYFLSEKLEATFLNNESFGFSVNCSDSVVVVGSPDYATDAGKLGRVRLFRKDPTKDSLTVISKSEDLTDISVVKNISLFDTKNNIKIRDLDIVDSYKNKILSIADQEITFKTLYDPAIYTTGTDQQVVDADVAWFEKNVGKIWWNLSTIKWNLYEQGDISYRIGNWNTPAYGATVDIYEWVETPLLPSDWSALADTPEGLANGISGQPLYPNNDVYSIKVLFNPNTERPTATKYYYWVRNSSIIPTNVIGRRLAASDIASLILNPIGSGIPFVSFIDKDKFLTYNFPETLTADKCLLNIEYINEAKQNLVHREYQLLTEGSLDSVPAEILEIKWLDSLAGYDGAGNRVPDPKLPEKLKYGISFRPLQSMFVDRLQALRITFDRINSILLTKPFADTINFTNLDLSDDIPSELLNTYDVAVDNFIDLQNVGTVRIKEAVLSANIVNGEVETIDIIDKGFGYKNAPFITIEGDGVGATAEITLDTQGRVATVTVTNRGKRYTYTNVKIRAFSVLVRTDVNLQGLWSIYAWDSVRRVFFRSQSQAFDTNRYWEFVDWYAPTYSSESRVVKEILNLYNLPEVKLEQDDLVKIKEYGQGGWALLKKLTNSFENLIEDFEIVGRYQGTIQILPSIYSIKNASIGFDNKGTYDTLEYDIEPTREMRNIFKAVKEDIFIDDLRIEWNNLFFTAIKYAFSEQPYIDWAFKTSFLNAIHNVGDLEKKLNYKNDNLDSYQKYVEEIKPYRTSIREYTSRYKNLDTANVSSIDFDLPPAYSAELGKILPVNSFYNRLTEYPWKWWADNKGLSVVDILISDGGSDYTAPPQVIIEGDGAGATAQAYISNGKVSAIKILNGGVGYTKTPSVILVGGNGSSVNKAKGAVVLGENKARSFDLTLKFDRIDKRALYSSAKFTESFVATGQSAIFELKYPPSLDKSKITVFKDDQLLLSSDYFVSLYKQDIGTYSILKGKLTFIVPPALNSKIDVTFDKDAAIFDSIGRIEKFYKPSSGMKGLPVITDNAGNITSRDYSQLMTGFDFGGVQIQGTTFDITGGWDALPWFTDSWDSVAANSDYYYVADGSTGFINLPTVPENGKILSIYLKRIADNKTIRIDDPNFVLIEKVTLDHEVNPPFSYDGSTTVTTSITFLESAGLTAGQEGYLGEAGAAIQTGWYVYGTYVQPDTRVTVTRNPTNEIVITNAGSPEFNQTYTRIPASLAAGYVALDYYVGKDNPDIRIFKYPNDYWFMGNNHSGNGISTKKYKSVGAPRNIWDVQTWEAEDSAVLPGPVTVPTNHILVEFEFSKSLLDWIYGAPNNVWQPDLRFESTVHAGPITNPNALIPTFVGDGSTTFVQIQGFLNTSVGDTLIFRPLDSDGSVTITDINLIDTSISGGTLSAMSGAYVTATGKTAEEIAVDGGQFVSPENVPAPEENIPGQILDSVSIKVYNFTPSAAAPFKVKISIGDGSRKIYDIGQQIFEARSVMVFIDKIKQEYRGDSTINYNIDFVNSTIEFVSAPLAGSIIEITSMGVGGVAILDYSEFVSDGETTYFLTRANFKDSQSVFVTVDGVQFDASFVSSTGIVDTPDKVLVEFALPPGRSQSVKVIVLGPSLDTDSAGLSLVRINQQQIVYDGSSRVFDLDNFVNLSRASAASSVLVELNGRQLKGVDTIYQVYDGTNNIVQIGVDPAEPIGTITSGNTRVYINDILRRFVIDYTYDGNQGQVIINPNALQVDDTIRIEADLRAEFFIEDNNLRIADLVTLNPLDEIEVTWFGEYPSLSVISDQYEGGKFKYVLSRTPISDSYVYVYRNGQRLTLNKDFYVKLPYGEVYLKEDGSITDEIKIVQYASDTYSLPSAYEINKDMLNIYRFNRFAETECKLAQDLAYYDTEMFVTNGDSLFAPYRERNIPGVIVIGSERIEYLVKDGNKLSQLRRGSQGTAIATMHIANTAVVDVSVPEQLPYTEEQERFDFVSDGSTVEIGPLPFTPIKSEKSNWFRETRDHIFGAHTMQAGRKYTIIALGTTDFTLFGASNNVVGITFIATGPAIGSGTVSFTEFTSIPETHFSCDEIEVFVSGKRLCKDAVTVFDETKGMYSPAGDIQIEAEFSVTGTTPYFRITKALEAGTRITVIRRKGSIWYERAAANASKGITLLKNDTAIARFIRQKATKVL